MGKTSYLQGAAGFVLCYTYKVGHLQIDVHLYIIIMQRTVHLSIMYPLQLIISNTAIYYILSVTVSLQQVQQHLKI